MTTTITIPLEIDLQLTLRSPDTMAAMARALSPGHVSTEPQAPASVSATPGEFVNWAWAPATQQQLILPHKPGTHWPEHDAWYAGPQMGLDGSFWHVLVPAAHLRIFASEKWGDTNTEISGANSTHDGMANTQAMVDSGNHLAQRVQALGEGLYLPAPAETLLMFATLKSVIGDSVLWTSRQYSADNAWVQYFFYGGQDVGSKDGEFRAVPVRRLSI